MPSLIVNAIIGTSASNAVQRVSFQLNARGQSGSSTECELKCGQLFQPKRIASGCMPKPFLVPSNANSLPVLRAAPLLPSANKLSCLVWLTTSTSSRLERFSNFLYPTRTQSLAQAFQQSQVTL